MSIVPVTNDFSLEKISEAMLSPLYVLKELIENAIDSGATAIKVSVSENCMGKITVADNGCGIDFTDAKYLFKAGFSSKIKDKPIFSGVYPLGFRGKFLFALSPLAKVKVASRCEGGQGFEFLNNFGLSELKKTFLEKCGTIVQITDLYCQEGALREQYKGDKVLNSLINRCVLDYALYYENIAFVFIADNKTVFSKPVCSLKEALYHIFGAKLLDDMVKIVDWNYGGISLCGAVVLPKKDAKASFGGYGCIALMGRRINNNALNKKIKDIFKYYFLYSQLPFYFLKIQTPIKDVNFDNDAAKMNPLFASEQNLCNCVKECLYKSLLYHCQTQKRKNAAPLTKGKLLGPLTLKEEKPLCFTTPPSLFEVNEAREETQNLYDFQKLIELQRDNLKHNLKVNTFANSKVVGMLFDKYIVAERENFFYFIDYPKARALFYYDAYAQQLQKQSIVTSTLYSPCVFTVRENDKDFFNKIYGKAKKYGFIFSHISDEYYKLDAVPSIFIGVLDCKAFVDRFVSKSCADEELFFKEIEQTIFDCLKFNTENLTLTDLKSFVKDFDSKRFRKTPSGEDIIAVYTLNDLRHRFKGKL